MQDTVISVCYLNGNLTNKKTSIKYSLSVGPWCNNNPFQNCSMKSCGVLVDSLLFVPEIQGSVQALDCGVHFSV